MEARPFVTYLKPRSNDVRINTHGRGWVELPNGQQCNPCHGYQFTVTQYRRSVLASFLTWLRGGHYVK